MGATADGRREEQSRRARFLSFGVLGPCGLSSGT